MAMYRFSYRTAGAYRLKALHIPADNAADATRMFLLSVGPGKRRLHPEGKVTLWRQRSAVNMGTIASIAYSDIQANPDAAPGWFQKQEWLKDNEAAPKVPTYE